MASTNSATQGKRMDYKQVEFDVTKIAPDAPAGEWEATIPRGECKVQPTKEDHYPMLIVPIRLDKTEEEGDEFEKALGAKLSVMIVFFGNEKARAARMSKLRLRQLCETADIDLDLIPKSLKDPENDLEPLIRALEGKKIKVWTKLTTRKEDDYGFIDGVGTESLWGVEKLLYTPPGASAAQDYGVVTGLFATAAD